MRHVYFKLSWEPFQVNRDEQAEKGDFPKFDKLKVKNEQKTFSPYGRHLSPPLTEPHFRKFEHSVKKSVWCMFDI